MRKPNNTYVINDLSALRMPRNTIRCSCTHTCEKQIRVELRFIRFAYPTKHYQVFVCKALLEEQAKVQVYDPQVKRSQMFTEFDYTCGVNKDNTPRLEESVSLARRRHVCSRSRLSPGHYDGPTFGNQYGPTFSMRELVVDCGCYLVVSQQSRAMCSTDGVGCGHPQAKICDRKSVSLITPAVRPLHLLKKRHPHTSRQVENTLFSTFPSLQGPHVHTISTHNLTLLSTTSAVLLCRFECSWPARCVRTNTCVPCQIVTCEDAYSAADGAHALAILTEW